jgi:hypothetical protein
VLNEHFSFFRLRLIVSQFGFLLLFNLLKRTLE